MSQYWPRELFLNADAEPMPCPERIDITGRRRILVYGPYVALPAGRWRLTAEFSLTAEAAANLLQVEIFQDPAVVVSKLIQPSRGGRFAVPLEAELSGEPVELRTWLPLPAFDGELCFHGATVERLDTSPPSSRSQAALSE
ncbi:MAG: hypothetical protein JWM33_2225 [Caulobacteraceae bacterium]|nr:hypothetical protein [Caulobacteraceae bacterium]